MHELNWTAKQEVETSLKTRVILPRSWELYSLEAAQLIFLFHLFLVLYSSILVAHLCLLICGPHCPSDFLLIYYILKQWKADFTLHPLMYSEGAGGWELEIVEKAFPGCTASCLCFASFLPLPEDWLPLLSWAWFHPSCPQMVPLAEETSNPAFISYCRGLSMSLFEIPVRKKVCLGQSSFGSAVHLPAVSRGENTWGFRAYGGEVGGAAGPLPNVQHLRAFHSLLSKKELKDSIFLKNHSNWKYYKLLFFKTRLI